MRFLLDTHTFLWYTAGDDKLSKYAFQLLDDTLNQPVLSMVSLWEMSIKVSTGKLRVGPSFTALVRDKVVGLGFELLPLTPEHLDALATLPFYHRDPFDRTLVAQCIHEKLPLLSRDVALDSYAIRRLW